MPPGDDLLRGREDLIAQSHVDLVAQLGPPEPGIEIRAQTENRGLAPDLTDGDRIGKELEAIAFDLCSQDVLEKSAQSRRIKTRRSEQVDIPCRAGERSESGVEPAIGSAGHPETKEHGPLEHAPLACSERPRRCRKRSPANSTHSSSKGRPLACASFLSLAWMEWTSPSTGGRSHHLT